jgi:HTH-type transcriptional regulator/antitoxin HigA
MAIQPIRTKRDHDEALACIDQLMGAKLGTLEGDEFDVPVTLVDAYESRHFPMDEPDGYGR